MSIVQALEKFAQLDPEVIFTVNSERYIKVLADLKKKYGIGFDRLVILTVTGDLAVEYLSDYLMREFELTQEKSKAAAKDLANTVLEPLAKRLLFLNADPDKKGITATQEKEVLRQIFAENLLVELSEYFLVKNAFNLRIFDLLEKDFNFKRELERLLYENNELATQKNIMVKGKNVSPTIANWLADFINKNNTGDFDAVTLSNYLTNTENTRNLSPQERQRLSELLNESK